MGLERRTVSQSPVKVDRDDRAKGGKDDDNGDADSEVRPGLRLHPAGCHHLAPIEPCGTVWARKGEGQITKAGVYGHMGVGVDC